MNLAFVPAQLVCSIIAWRFPALNFLRAEGGLPQFGYERTWAPLSLSFLLLLALFVAQAMLRVSRSQPIVA